MRVSSKSAVLCCGVSLTILAAVAWFVGVPTLLTPSSFVACAAVLTGLIWVASITYLNGSPASSLAQSLNDAENAARAEHALEPLTRS
jgi:hypothetical protein